MKKGKFIFMIMLCLPIVMQAQQVTLEEAIIVGKNVIQDNKITEPSIIGGKVILNNGQLIEPALPVKETYILQNSRSDVLLYEVVMEDGQGVLLSGNKMCMPVLGYFRSTGVSILDTLSTEIPPGLISLVKGYAEQVQRSFEEDFEENENNATWQQLLTQKAPSAQGSEIVSPLTTSKWNQYVSNDGSDCEAYNYYVTKTSKYCKLCSSSKKCTTGCAAVAMAQVMYYWKYPMNYDWCNMADSLVKSYTENCRDTTWYFPGGWATGPICDTIYTNYETQRDAVAKLIYDAAESGIGTDYCFGATCSTTALPSALGRSLKNNFGYNSDATFGWKTSYAINDGWKKMLKRNLNNGRPVIYGSLGLNADAHTFVCDGYDSKDFFHFNWGWGGYLNDSWWKLDYIRPDGSHYDVSEYAVFDIYPDDNFNFCNYNVTLPFALSFIPAYPTNLTLDFNSFNNTISPGQNVTYKAHNSIIIKPGFRAAAGSKFRAYIEPCAKCQTTTSPNHLPQNPNINSENEDENSNNISNLESSISVFPNPTTGIVNIIAENTKIEKISVFDISGKVLENNNNFAGTTLDLSWLNNGVYFIKIQTPLEQTTHKVIIQK